MKSEGSSQLALMTLAILPLSGCGGPEATTPPISSSPAKVGAETPATPNGILLEFEVNDRRRLALGGDARSAYDLFRHFQQSGDPVEAERWARIGAENGEQRSMMFLAYLYEMQGGQDGCLRAVYWLKRAKGVLEASPDRSSASEVQRASVQAYIRDTDEEIARLKRQTPGCQ
jgi:hypothetical protein